MLTSENDVRRRCSGGIVRFGLERAKADGIFDDSDNDCWGGAAVFRVCRY